MYIKRVFRSPLFQSAGIYTIATAINSSIPFLLMPILTRYLTTDDYGITAMFGVLISLLSPFINLSLPGAVTRQYYEVDSIDMPVYITNCIMLCLASTALIGGGFCALAEPIGKVASFPAQWISLVVIVSFAQFISQLNLVLWQVQVKPKPYGIYQISQTALNAGLSILFVVYLGLTWQGRLGAQGITAVSFALFGLMLLLKRGWIKFEFNKLYIMNALSFGVPLIPHALSGVFKTMLDRLMITAMVSLSATGVYSVACSLGSIIGLAASAFNQAFVPWLYQKLSDNDYGAKIKIVRLTYWYFTVIIISAIGLGLIAPWFLSLYVGPQFWVAYKYVIWIALANAFTGMYFMVVNYIFYAQRTGVLAVITFSTALMSVFINYIAIQQWDAMGAAYTYAFTQFITFLCVWIAASRIQPMPWDFWRRNTKAK